MQVKVFQHLGEISNEAIAHHTVVVIDVLRATSVITTALANHAKEIIVTTEIDQALEEYNRRKPNECILGGERNMNKIKGFHYANSPLSYLNEDIKGKTIILTTTNGTRAINLCQQARDIYIGSILNCSFVAALMARKKNDITIVCAGSFNTLSLDDALCAGMMIAHLDQLLTFTADDFVWCLKMIYQQNKNNLKKALKNCRAYNELIKNGNEQDIDFCLKKDIYPIAPRFESGRITL